MEKGCGERGSEGHTVKLGDLGEDGGVVVGHVERVEQLVVESHRTRRPRCRPGLWYFPG
jgi:hypothetical protein